MTSAPPVYDPTAADEYVGVPMVTWIEACFTCGNNMIRNNVVNGGKHVASSCPNCGHFYLRANKVGDKFNELNNRNAQAAHDLRVAYMGEPGACRG